MRDVITAYMVALILVGTLVMAFNVWPVEASGTIYIRADGSINPPTANITTIDSITFTFTDDNCDSIVVEKDDIVIDGAGHTLQGSTAIWSRGIDLTGRTNVTIKNTQIIDFYYGIWLNSSSSDNSVSGNNITNNYDGVYLGHSSNNNNVSGNNITNNFSIGLLLVFSDYNDIIRNTITANSYDSHGIWLDSSSSNSIVENTIATIYYGGIRVDDSSSNSIIRNTIAANEYDGILLVSSDYNNVSGNNITSNRDGIVLNSSSDYNNVTRNTIANNEYGILFYSSSNNSISHNNFINNMWQASSYPSANVWDAGYPSGGNYWSDYEERYPNATEIDDSGLWDTPYTIDEDNQDNYPLMSPYTWSHDIAVTNVVTSKTGCLPMPTVGQGYSVDVNATVENQGDFSETFNLTAFANSFSIGKQEVSLNPGETKIVTFTWNTSSWTMGNYTIKASASFVPGEADTDDNTCINGVVKVVLAGDIDGNGIVDMRDIGAQGRAFGSYPGHPRWNPNADINDDRKIDMRDIGVAARNFGQSG